MVGYWYTLGRGRRLTRWVCMAYSRGTRESYVRTRREGGTERRRKERQRGSKRETGTTNANTNTNTERDPSNQNQRRSARWR